MQIQQFLILKPMRTKKIHISIGIILLVSTLSTFMYLLSQQKANKAPNLTKANIEALMSDTEGFSGSCTHSYLERCVIICPRCKTEHIPISGNIENRRPSNLSGTCDNCDFWL